MTALLAAFDLSGMIDGEAQRLHRSLSTINRCSDTALALVSRHRRDMHGHRTAGAKDVANDCARNQGVSPSSINRGIGAAEKLDLLAEVDAAARRGELSARELELIANTAVHNPDAQQRLLAAKNDGLAALQEECQRVRREGETSEQTEARLRAQRNLRMWRDSEGMLHISVALSPEDGGITYVQLTDAVRHAYRNTRRRTPPGEVPETIGQIGADVVVELLQRGMQPQSPPPSADDGSKAADTPAFDGSSRRVDNAGSTTARNDCSGNDAAAKTFDDTHGGDEADPSTADPHQPGQTASDDADEIIGIRIEARSGDMLAGWHGRRSSVEFVVSLDALLRGDCASGETCELLGVGASSATYVRDLLPDAFIKFITMRGPKQPDVACHAGRRLPGALVRALYGTHPPPDPSRGPVDTNSPIAGSANGSTCSTNNSDHCGTGSASKSGRRGSGPSKIHNTSNITVNIVLDANRIDEYAPAIGEIIRKRGKRIPPMASAQQHINAFLRTALLVSGYVCSTPGCNTRGYLEIDHDVERSRGGPTAWRNLRYLCWHHHAEKTRRYNRGRHPDRQVGKRQPPATTSGTTMNSAAAGPARQTARPPNDGPPDGQLTKPPQDRPTRQRPTRATTRRGGA